MRTDVRQALRQIVHHPRLTAVAVVTLAIGIAVNAVAFSAVNALLFKKRAGFDVPGAGRVVVTGRLGGAEGLSIAESDRLAAATAGALSTAVEGQTSLAWQRSGTTEMIWALVVSRSYFEILETRPLLGRLLISADQMTAPAAVISERFWRDRLQGVPLSAARLTLNGADVAVVGVMPDSFEGPGGLYAPEVWLPFEARGVLALAARLEEDDEPWLGMIGRLQPTASLAEADARLHAGALSMAHEWPRTHARLSARFSPMKERVAEVRALTWPAAAGMAAVGLVLVLACFNVATLLLTRAIDRQREMGIRAAIGASRWRLVRQQIIEGLVLSTLAGGVAAVVAVWSQDLLGAFAMPIPSPQRLNLTPDATVIGFITAMVVVSGILPGLAPAFAASRLNLVHALSAHGQTGSGGRPSPVRQGLIVLQIAGSTAFLSVAALLVQSFVLVGHLHPGFERDRAVVVALHPASQGYDAKRARVAIGRIIDRVRALPGVVAVTAADRIPFAIGYPRLTEVAMNDQPCADGGCPGVLTYAVDPNYFQTLDVALVAGQTLGDAPGDILINEAFADRWFSGANAVGQVIRVGPSSQARVIVGTVRNTVQFQYGEQSRPVLYAPLSATDYEGGITIVARTAGDPAALVRPIGEAIYAADPGIAPQSLETMRARLRLPRWPMQAAGGFFGTCGVLALVLATIGLAAVMSHAVRQRSREFGVRLAVGATPTRLVRDVLGGGLRVVLPGIVVGIAAGLTLAGIVRSALVGMTVDDPETYAGIALLQTIVALVACALPAHRASRVDPSTALRAD